MTDMANRVDLVGIGECMVELSEADAGLLRASFAGDVFNTLWYAKRALGNSQKVQFLSAVGTDPLSDQMLNSIQQAGIDISKVRRIPDRRPGLYMIHLDGAERSFSYWRDHSAARLLASDRAHLSDAMDAASAIYFSGITLAILPPEDAHTFLDLVAVARAQNKLVAFDPNIRPVLWPDVEHMQAMMARAASHATIVLPSFDDETKAFGDRDTGATLTRYASCGAQTVVLKNGDSDVLVQRAGAEVEVYTTDPVAMPVDTTGAGDSFNGAFLAEFVRSQDMAASVRAGQKCAAEVICHRGALIDQRPD
jgi:2-dehydro-3-deoxygluconokinase